MSSEKIHGLGIRQRILLLTLLPLLFISLLLGGYFTYTRLQDAEETLIDRGQLLARLVASSSEFGFITNNNQLLKSISKGPFLEQEVADILFLNERYELILRSANFHVDLQPAAPQTYQQDGYWYFVQPIRTTGIPFLDNTEFQEPEKITDIIGWVLVAMTEAKKNKQEEQILVTSSLLLLIGVMFTFFLAQRFGRSISLPLLELSHVMGKLQTGHLVSRVTNTYTGEFNSLAHGLNELADTVQQSIEIKENKIDLATRKLQSTLHHLEKQNNALLIARKLAEDANKAKDDFLARMSHELRTPLTSVVGFTRLLKQTSCSDEQLEHIRIINQTSQLLLSIIDDILDFSKLQQDAISIEEIPFSLEDIVYAVLEMQAPQAHEKGLELVAHMPERSCLDAQGDPTRIHQIVSNVVANAVKFTNSGSVEVQVESTLVNEQRSLFTIKIIDTGIGIPAHQLEQLFKAFTQADTSITRRFGGSGLGLIISEKLTELMGGKLTMTSQEGVGTTLTLLLPLKTKHREFTLSNSIKASKKSILYYEENASLRRAITTMLDKYASTLHVAKHLDEWVKLAPEYQTVMIGIPAEQEKQNAYLKILSQPLTHNPELLVFAPNGLDISTIPSSITILKKPIRPFRLFERLHLTVDVEPTREELIRPQRTIKVVLAEDNELNRLLINKILNTFNIQTVIAKTGLETIKLVNETNPDIVIMDAHMPIMDGFEATKRIKAVWPDLPVIALTASIIEREHLALYEAGVTKVLLKPINDNELLSTITSLTFHSSTALTLTQNNTYTEKSNIEQYNITREQLKQELQSLSRQLSQGFTSQNINIVREINHQLAGIVGLYELPEIENCVCEIEALIRKQSIDWSVLWKVIWRLTRLLKIQE
ncbi:ATP-binding protein [Neptunomonas antarctica]|uniref:histidine kinase n=1 Tax=Neptunomonas antarctica TaxID=619304 RepID=A0A1N7N332_9GAMM|nr:ATP-binding protein [Neptunomonas antarctica]SIS92777.1 two-component system, NarL family, sensor histidine kinase BarA [Neptunomonas antarctica]